MCEYMWGNRLFFHKKNMWPTYLEQLSSYEQFSWCIIEIHKIKNIKIFFVGSMA